MHGLKIVVKLLPNFLSCLYPCFYQFLSIITLFPSFTFVEYIAKDQINEIDQSLSKSKNKREIRNFHFPSALSKRKKNTDENRERDAKNLCQESDIAVEVIKKNLKILFPAFFTTILSFINQLKFSFRVRKCHHRTSLPKKKSRAMLKTTI